MSRTSKAATASALLAVAVALAGCGGSSNTTSGGTTTKSPSHPTNTSGDPASAILKTLGLEECFQHQLPPTAILNTTSTAITSSFAGARMFRTAADCSKKGPRTTIVAATFSSHEGIAAAKAAFRKKYPKSGVASYLTVVVGVVGGANPQQTADKIIKLLTAGVVKG